MLVTAFGVGSKNSWSGDPSMTIVSGINQYLDYYRIVVPSGYDRNYVSIMIKDGSQDSFCLNNMLINTSDIVFQKNVPVGNVIYNVKTIRVVEGEVTVSTFNGERFGLIFTGMG